MKKLLIAFGFLLAACGGGGGGSGSSASNFAGRWTGDLAPTINDCNDPTVGVESVAITINQNGTKVVGDGDSGATYEGVATADGLTMYKTDSSQTCSTGSVASVTTKIDFLKGSGGKDEVAAFVTLKSHCDGSLIVCTVQYGGVMNR